MINDEIKDVYGKPIKEPKMYQEGGNIGFSHQYDLSNLQNPQEKQMLQQLQEYGFNFDPTKTVMSQIPSMDFSGDAISNMLRGKWGIGAKVQMPSSMFSPLTPGMFEQTTSEFYDPARELTHENLTKKYIESKRNISGGGFAGSGQVEEQEKELLSGFAGGITEKEMGIDKLISQAFGNITGTMQDWDATAQKLRYG